MIPRIKYLLCTVLSTIIYTTLMWWCNVEGKSQGLVTGLYLWSFIGVVPYCIRNYDKFMLVNTYGEKGNGDK